MTGPAWPLVALAELAEIQGGIQKQPKRTPRANAYPFLRVANVMPTGLDLSDVHQVELFSGELDTYRVEPGDLLVVEGNGSASQIGRAAVWRGSISDAVHQNHLIRVRPGRRLLPEFLGLVWNSPGVRDELSALSSSTSGLHTLSVAKLKRVLLPVPALHEQRRIVAILEEHLSDLDDGARSVRKAEMRCRLLTRSVMLGLIPEVGSWPARWGRATVSAVGSVELGRQRHPDWHHGSNMRPYLRVANVFEDRIDTSDLMEMHWPEDTFARFKLRPGQILLNEGQSPQYLGRPAMYRGEPADVAFTNSLLRFTAGPEVLPEFALLVFRRHMHAGRFARESRITTNIAHLSATRLKGVEFPVPTLAEQKDLVDLARERLGAVSRIEGSIQAQTRRAAGLRRAVLSAAFSGRLTGHGSSTDVISELAEEESA